MAFLREAKAQRDKAELTLSKMARCTIRSHLSNAMKKHAEETSSKRRFNKKSVVRFRRLGTVNGCSGSAERKSDSRYINIPIIRRKS